MRSILIAGMLLCLLTGNFSAVAQDTMNVRFGNGLYSGVAADSSFSFKLSARFQGRFAANWEEYEGVYYFTGSGLSIRRARLKMEGFAFSPKLEYKLQLGLSNSDTDGASPFSGNTANIIKDAYISWNFAGGFSLIAGQAKLPGNRSQLISSANQQFVDRSDLNGFFNLGRETGLQLEHEHRVSPNIYLREIIAFSQGEGPNVMEDNLGGFSYTGRIELMPFGKFASKGAYSGGDLKREQSPKLAIAAAYNYNDNAVRTGANRGDYMLRNQVPFESDIRTLFLDAIFKWRGLSIMGEYAKRDAERTEFFAAGPASLPSEIYVVPTGYGWSVQGGYLLANDYEVALRYTTLDLEGNADYPAEQYTVGLSKYISGHNLKVQTDLSYERPQLGEDTGLMYRLQFELQF